MARTGWRGPKEALALIWVRLSRATNPEPSDSASKNFYVELLAAIEVARNYSDYFGPLEVSPPRQYDTVSLKRSHRLSTFTQTPTLTEKILRDYNPHIREGVWEGSKILPAGLDLHLPKGQGEVVQAALETAPLAPSPILVARGRGRLVTGCSMVTPYSS